MNAPIDISGVELNTSRLLLRPWRQEDLADFYAYASVDGVGQMAGWLPHKTPEDSQNILNHFIANKKCFAVEYQGKVIGSLGIEEYDEEKYPDLAEMSCRELGFVLSRDYWGLGLMPEAVRAVLAWLFREKQLDAVLCGHFTRNAQSARVQEKCGFHYYASDIFHTYYGAEEQNTENILTKSEWESLTRCGK